MLSRYLLELSSDGHSPLTVREYAATIRRWEQSGLSPVDYLATIRVKPSTRTMRGLVLRRYLTWEAARNGTKNPLAGLHFKAPIPCPERPFTQVEIDAMLVVSLSNHERAVIICLLRLGVRASELAAVRLGDIDGDTVIIRRGKGGKPRTLAATGEVGPCLEAVASARLAYQAIYRMVRAVGRRAGVVGVHPHRFRYTFACCFLEAGGDVLALQTLLGHSDLSMTRRYVQFNEGMRALEAHRRFLQGA